MDAPVSEPGILVRRWRVLAAAALGLAGFLAARSAGARLGLSGLVGWNIAAAAYLVTTLHIILRATEAQVRARAAIEDETPWVTTTIVLSAIAAGLAATVAAMHESKSSAATAHAWAAALSVSTLALGWLAVQAIFTLHYAHRYFAGDDGDGGSDPGVLFPGQPPTSYHDFLYMALCIGVSGQVSDFSITTTAFRRLVTVHAGLAFFFNTAVLALGINILASIIGG
jgi:uncharacterized membrane protein